MYGIICGKFIDGTGNKVKTNVCLYVDGDRIVNISNKKLYKNINYIDASNMTVLPGLIDAHKHILNCGGSGMGVGLSLRTIYSNLKKMQQSGVTSLLDLGSAYFLPPLERLLNPKIRIFNAISIITCPGGYPAEYMPKKFYSLGAVTECDSFESIYTTVKKLYKKDIKILYFEIFYSYLSRLNEIIDYFNEKKKVEVRFRTGIESFDNDFRKKIYNKNIFLDEKKLEELSEKIYSVCLLIATQGQTKEMIKKDIEIGLKYFKAVTINIFVDNGTAVKRDVELVKWFVQDMKHLFNDDRIEILIDNKDLGVFEQ